MLMVRLLGEKARMTVAVNGSIAGLVSITAGCASMTPLYALITGFVGGIIMVLCSRMLLRFRLDDVVDAVSVHGFAGAWGTLAAGLFLTGNMFSMDQIIVQLIGIGACLLWVFPLAFLMYLVLSMVMTLRIDATGEQRGLDYSEHTELGYPEFQSNKLHHD